MIPIKEGFLMTPWAILYDENSLALERLYGLVSAQTPVLCLPFAQADQTFLQSHHIIHLGREENCPAPAGGYRIRAEKDENGLLRILLTGDGMINLLYAVVDFENDYLVRARNADASSPFFYFKPLFTDDMPEFDQSYVPSIRTRGLWTWGYVIHDYRGYLDHMVTLKLNQLIIWNDTPPLNAREIIAYAHARGIQIIWGFAWGWDTNCLATNVQDLSSLTRQIIETYDRDYAPLGGDGIYFQSFTETSQEEIGGVLIADAVVRLVNQTADQLLSRYPDLKIQFGLHATSVRNRLSYIAKVDPRVDILWEDCGAFPYHYFAKKTEGLDETAAFTREIVACGYLTQLGLHHDNGFNPYNLSSDLMEPFRPLVDRAVYAAQVTELTKEVRRSLIDILNAQVAISGARHTVLSAIGIYTRSVFEALNEEDPAKIRFFEP